jgi:Family of unknown function (DUF6152)
MKIKLASFLALATLAFMSAPMFAHHGTSITYLVDRTITVTGVVTEWVYSYPHPQLYFDVKDEAGNVQHWGSEFGPTPLMMKNLNVGWSKASIKPGDAVKMVCNPHKVPGATACLVKDLFINGKPMKLNAGGGNNAAQPTEGASR